MGCWDSKPGLLRLLSKRCIHRAPPHALVGIGHSFKLMILTWPKPHSPWLILPASCPLLDTLSLPHPGGQLTSNLTPDKHALDSLRTCLTPHRFSVNPSPCCPWGRLCTCFSYANQSLPPRGGLFFTHLSFKVQLRPHLLHEAILTPKLSRCFLWGPMPLC